MDAQAQASALTPIDADAAISYLIAASGNSKLAAVRATNDLGAPVTEAQILVTIANDPSSFGKLANQVKLFSLIQALDMLRLTQQAFIGQLPSLEPKDTAKTYTGLLASVASLSANAPAVKTPGINELLRNLPPEIAAAVTELASLPAPDHTSDFDPATTVSSPARGSTASAQTAPTTISASKGQSPEPPPVIVAAPSKIEEQRAALFAELGIDPSEVGEDGSI